jgi:hypothetical protein
MNESPSGPDQGASSSPTPPPLPSSPRLDDARAGGLPRWARVILWMFAGFVGLVVLALGVLLAICGLQR